MNMEKENPEELEELLTPEKLIVFPTDTVYGLGGDGRNKDLMDKIYRLKRRSKEKPLSLHLFSKEEVYKYVLEPSSRQKELIEELLPGSYTLILPASSEAPRVSVGKGEKVGLRVPDCRSFAKLSPYIDFPLVGTSVNKSGEPPLNDIDDIVETYGGLVDVFIEAEGEMEGSSSTVLDLTFEPPKVLRGTYPREG